MRLARRLQDQQQTLTHPCRRAETSKRRYSRETRWKSNLPDQPFSLIRWFAALSLVCIALLAGAGGIIVSTYLQNEMLQRDAEIAEGFLRSLAETGRHENYFTSPAAGDAELEDFFERLLRSPDVFRINAYRPDHSLVWSSDSELIGEHFDDNDELDEALSGEEGTVFELQSAEHAKAEHQYLPPGVERFVESYVRIHGASGDPIGVLEVYRTPETLFASMARVNRLVWAIAALASLVLYAALFWIVRRGDRLLREQRAQLAESEMLAAIGEMAASVAHNIRNPLASIRATAQLADASSPPERIDEAYRDIIHSVDRADAWIRELLTFSWNEAPLHEPTRLEDVAARTLKTFAEAMEKRKIHAVLRADGEAPSVDGDAGMLSQMLQHIVSNAVDSMASGGEIAISVTAVRAGRWVELSVIDSGPGIASPRIAEVFKPFVTSKPGGVGLGLLLARRVAQRHGGDITISSTAAAGTRVSVRLPGGDRA